MFDHKKIMKYMRKINEIKLEENSETSVTEEILR